MKKKKGHRARFIESADLKKVAALAYDANSLASVHDPDIVKAIKEIIKFLNNDDLDRKVSRVI